MIAEPRSAGPPSGDRKLKNSPSSPAADDRGAIPARSLADVRRFAVGRACSVTAWQLDPLAVALSINVGASLVDVSPLSTLGALCVAAVPNDESLALFRKLLAWGVSMIVVGAVLCQVFVGAFARL